MISRLLGTVLVDGLRGLLRGRALTLAAVAVIGVTFSVAALALLAAENLANAVRAWAQPGVIRVYLNETATPADAAVLAARVATDPRVASAEAISPDEIRTRFGDMFPEMKTLTGPFAASPFPPEVELTMVPQATQAVRLDLVETLKEYQAVAAVLTDDLWADQLLDASLWIRRVGQTAGFFFSLVAALVVAGIIRISLAGRQDEIDIMTVVGAPRAFIAGPFVVEGVLLGAAGGGVAIALAWLFVRAAAWTGQPLAGGAAVSFLPPAQAASIMAAAALAGAVAAAWTAGRALRPR